jgi:hypothetical protein
MDGVYYDASLKRVLHDGRAMVRDTEASPGWVYVHQQKDSDHNDLISRIKTRPGSGISLFAPTLSRF